MWGVTILEFLVLDNPHPRGNLFWGLYLEGLYTGEPSSWGPILSIRHPRASVWGHVHELCVLSCFSHIRLCFPMDCSLPSSSVHGILQQEYWSGFPCPPPGDLPQQGIKAASLKSPALAGGFFFFFFTTSVI